jgi:hypothetical protein
MELPLDGDNTTDSYIYRHWKKQIIVMETEFDVNKEIKKEVLCEDELLFDKKVANDEDMSNHEMIEIKDEFGKTMEDFDLSHAKSTSETVDCSDFKSLGCDKSSAHEIVCSNDFQNFAQRKGSIMPLYPEFEDFSFHCEQCPYSNLVVLALFCNF